MSEITFAYDKTNQQEFCLIETQGSLETDQNGGLTGLRKFATIERHPDHTVSMVVGIHRVPGTTVQLASPLAVLQKTAINHYQIAAIIKEKFMFKIRPDVVLQQEISQLPSINSEL